MGAITPPRPLAKSDHRTDFDCGKDSLNQWFRRHAWRNQKENASRTYVVSDEATGNIVGYVTLAAGQIAREFLAKSDQRNKPNPVPVLILGQLAIDINYHGQGIGVDLLQYALKVAVKASETVGAVGVLTHPLVAEVREFYGRWGFRDLEQDPKGSMLVKIKDLRVSGF